MSYLYLMSNSQSQTNDTNEGQVMQLLQYFQWVF